MAKQIGDYALIADGETAALVNRDGTIEFMCWPGFGSDACFAAMLGDRANGYWQVSAPGHGPHERAYCDRTTILESIIAVDGGRARLTDFMPIRDGDTSALVRIIEGIGGTVSLCSDLCLRFDYGRLSPWVMEQSGGTVEFLCGPHAATLETNVAVRIVESRCVADFTLSEGETAWFVLRHRPSHLPAAPAIDPFGQLAATKRFWRAWIGRCDYDGPHREIVLRSLLTIKAMSSLRTGGIIAAPTLGLPEQIGGPRNWDYRYCWPRDATFTLLALLHSGFHDEAARWRDWLLRAAAGMPQRLQPVYGIDGEHRLAEWTADWLGGFRGSRPVRVGNAAYTQLQIDIYGEVMDMLHQSRGHDIPAEDWSWRLQRQLVAQVEEIWREPDAGIWEARHGGEHFTHSRVMAWVAIDRAVRAAEQHRLDWPLKRLRALRDTIHRDVCENGYDDARGGFMRSYETHEPDAATLLLPIVGFLPATDPRVLKTVDTIERELMRDGFVMRYETARSPDGLPPGEGVFLPCSFWYVDNLIMQGRIDEAARKFEDLVGLCNDLGLLSEEYAPAAGEMLGNFPQALTHVSLVNTAQNLARDFGPVHARSSGQDQVPRRLPQSSQ